MVPFRNLYHTTDCSYLQNWYFLVKFASHHEYNTNSLSTSKLGRNVKKNLHVSWTRLKKVLCQTIQAPQPKMSHGLIQIPCQEGMSRKIWMRNDTYVQFFPCHYWLYTLQLCWQTNISVGKHASDKKIEWSHQICDTSVEKCTSGDWHHYLYSYCWNWLSSFLLLTTHANTTWICTIYSHFDSLIEHNSFTATKMQHVAYCWSTHFHVPTKP